MTPSADIAARIRASEESEERRRLRLTPEERAAEDGPALRAGHVLRRHDEEARRAFVEEGSLPESLAAARVGLEHVEHHGRGLRFAGSSYVGDTIEHRFRCRDCACAFALTWRVTA